MPGCNTACGHCGDKATKRCGHCQNMQYCSAECQQADWQFHKTLCKTFADFKERPSPNTRRAIYFPQNGDRPNFIWLPVDPQAQAKQKPNGLLVAGKSVDSATESNYGMPKLDKEGGSCLPSDCSPLGKFEDDTMSMALVMGPTRRGEHLDHNIYVIGPRKGRDHVTNMCVLRTAKEPPHPIIPRGPLIVFGMTKVVLPKYTVDLDTNDLTLALDAMVAPWADGATPHFARKVAGVKVHSGAMPFLEDVKVPKRHPIFKSGTLSAIAEFEGKPVQSWFCPVSSVTTPLPTTAVPATFDPKVLYTDLDPKSAEFANIPAAIKNDKRNMLIVRPDAKADIPLTTGLLKILADSLSHVQVHLADAKSGAPEERIAKEKARSEADWDKTKAMVKSLGLSDGTYSFPKK